jgi:hypothetical protein
VVSRKQRSAIALLTLAALSGFRVAQAVADGGPTDALHSRVTYLQTDSGGIVRIVAKVGDDSASIRAIQILAFEEAAAVRRGTRATEQVFPPAALTSSVIARDRDHVRCIVHLLDTGAEIELIGDDPTIIDDLKSLLRQDPPKPDTH